MPAIVAVGRVLFVLLFVFSGASKFLDLTATAQVIAEKVPIPAPLSPYASQLEAAVSMPMPQILAIVSGAVEIVCGIFIGLNLGARVFAAILILFVLVTTFYFHDFWNMSGVDRTNNLVEALKNLSLVGALLLIVGYPRPAREVSTYAAPSEDRY